MQSTVLNLSVLLWLPTIPVNAQEPSPPFRIQVLASPDSVAAAEVATDLVPLLTPDCLVEVERTESNPPLFRLRVGPFFTRDAADEVMTRLRESALGDGWLVPPPQGAPSITTGASCDLRTWATFTSDPSPVALTTSAPARPTSSPSALSLGLARFPSSMPPLQPSDGPAGAAAPTSPSFLTPLRVFYDCQARGCEESFLRQEITFVDWVRDREVADLHLLVTSISTGSGDTYELTFAGRNAYEVIRHNLTFTSSDTDTRDERREGFARIVRLGLAPFVAQAGTPADLDVVLRPGSGPRSRTTDPQTTNDPWNFWTFSTSVGAQLNGQESTKEVELTGSLSANRTTEAWKIRSRTSFTYQENTYRFDDRDFQSLARFFEANLLIARSLGDHWAVGGLSEVWSSTFQNVDLGKRVGLALEWSLFPYQESSRREVTALYTVGWNAFEYNEVTLFDVTEETLYDHDLIVSVDFNQPWGNFNVSLAGSQYLADPDKFRVQASSSLGFRLARGLSLNVSGAWIGIRDQRNIPKRSATDEEVLLYLRALATDYQYYSSIGISYTFGSIFNNVVNPRLQAWRRTR